MKAFEHSESHLYSGQPRCWGHEGQSGVRVAFFLSLLSLIALANTACVRNVRTANDNFYVINRKAGVPKASTTPSRPSQPLVDQQAAKTQVLQGQVNTAPRPKSSLSNAEILEEENSRISFFLRKAQAEPNNAAASFELGRAYHEFRLYDEALRQYQNALRLEPTNPVYLDHTGRLWRDWGSPQVGADLVNSALNFDPGFVEAWNTLGTILDRQGDAERAQNAYLHALSLNPNLDYVHSNLCFSYLQSGMVSEAIAHGERAKQLNPAMLVAHNNLGWAYGMLGELDRAIEEFSQSGGEAVARNNLGLILLRRGQIAESLEQFRMAARMRPYYKDAVANYKMARDLSFQRRREAKNLVVEQADASAIFGFARIADTGLGLLSNDSHLLARQPAAPRPETVETSASSVDSKEFGGLFR